MAAEETVHLTLPRTPRQGEAVYLLLTLGVLKETKEVDIETEDGLYIGLASPYGIPPGKPAGTYIIPVPTAMMRGTSLSVRFRVPTGDGTSRPATADEVRDVKIRLDDPEELK